jgi:hypothetical protein
VEAVELSGTAPAAREGSAGVELESSVDAALEVAWRVAMWRVFDIEEENKKQQREV